MEVAESILFHLNKLKENQEALCDETENVAQILKQEVVNCDRKKERYQEATNVEFDDKVKELLSLEELEVN